ncbi:EVE domain-containing protein [Rahnella selenatireducens]|uniref:EVE domain-containing protein n=1 Tax=Rahnella selenatireducens TaxID=3389797 RepID=UPI0039692B18
MNAWIFRGNREEFDIDSYLQNFDYIYWAVKHKKHQDEINIGDPVFIWRSKGSSKDPYGLVAFGHVVESPVSKEKVKYPKRLLEEYWKKEEVSPIKVGITIDEARLNLQDGMVESALLQRDPELAGMQLLTARQGTNFKINESELKKIYRLWAGDFTFSEMANDYEAEEGNVVLRIHKFRERDRTLVKKAKENFIKRNKELFCEVCGYNFNDIYGFSYAEVHHKTPLSELKSTKITSTFDLAILCANCHKAVHRIDSPDPWHELLKLHNKDI